MTAVTGPVLKWPGAKWRMAAALATSLPAHTTYLEPFFGSGAVLFAKPRALLETVNDLDSRVVNLFSVLRDRPEALARAIDLTPWAREEHRGADTDECLTGEPVEDARRFLVRSWQSHGADCKWRNSWRQSDATGRSQPARTWLTLPDRILGVVDRLRGVQIDSRPAVEIIARHAVAGCLIYADPPYPLSTRHRSYYRHEMTDADHLVLLDALDAHPGPVVLSGYACDLYDHRLAHWQRETSAAVAGNGVARTEVVWRNARAALPGLFAGLGVTV